jgi:hypothetical protein
VKAHGEQRASRPIVTTSSRLSGPMACLRRVLIARVQGAIVPAPLLTVIRPIGSPPRVTQSPFQIASASMSVCREVAR